MLAQLFDGGAPTAIVLLAMLIGPALIVVWLALHYRSRDLRLRTIRSAIDSGSLDANTKRELLTALTAESQRRSEFWRKAYGKLVSSGRSIVFVAGWMTFVIAGLALLGMVIAGGARASEIQAAIIVTAFGFALVSLPLALTEMQKGRSPQNTR